MFHHHQISQRSISNKSRSKQQCSMDKAYNLTRNKIGKWDCNSCFSLEGDHSCCCGLTWPSKHYKCSFCKREFISAQALGGHMNVHRNDRARLRLLSSWVSECHNPKPNSNPNPNSSRMPLSSHSVNFSLYPHHSLLSDPSLNTPSSSPPLYGETRRKPLIPQLGDLSKEHTLTPFLGVEKMKRHAQKHELEVGGVTGLDMERGFKDPKEVLDLELRLGCF